MRLNKTGVSRLAVGVLLALALSACYNRGTSPDAMFPIKSGEVWQAKIITSYKTITTEFQLDGPPYYDKDSQEAEAFLSNNGELVGKGYANLDYNLFRINFSLASESNAYLACQVFYAERLERITVGFSFFTYQGTSQSLKDGCTLTRLR